MKLEIQNESPSEAVVNAIATEEECDPTDLSPLYHAIDTEALDKLVSSGQCEVVRFSYEGYTVTVRSDAEVVLEPQQ